MAVHNDFGNAGETLAAAWLEERDFHIIARNWRAGRYEIDIIATLDRVLHFVEVKARSDDRFGLPEDWVDRRKGRRLMKAGAAFQTMRPEWKEVQYDIISILIGAGGRPDVFFIEDVYWW